MTILSPNVEFKCRNIWPERWPINSHYKDMKTGFKKVNLSAKKISVQESESNINQVREQSLRMNFASTLQPYSSDGIGDEIFVFKKSWELESSKHKAVMYSLRPFFKV